MENNVDRYAEVIKDLLIILNARAEAREATTRIKQRLTIHETSTKPRCVRKDANLAIRQLMVDDLIGELIVHKVDNTTEKVKYKNFVYVPVGFVSIQDNGAQLIADLISKVGEQTLMEGIL